MNSNISGKGPSDDFSSKFNAFTQSVTDGAKEKLNALKNDTKEAISNNQQITFLKQAYTGSKESLSSSLGEGVNRLSTLFSNTNKSINTLFGHTIPEGLPHMSLGKMVSTVMSKMSFKMGGNINHGTAKTPSSTSLQRSHSNDIVKAQFEAIEPPMEFDTQKKYSAGELLDLAKTHPKAVGKFLFDQQNPPTEDKTKQKTYSEGEMKDIATTLSKSEGGLTPAQFSTVISAAYSREIALHDQPGTLMRGNNVGSMLLGAFETVHLRPILNASPEMKSFLNSIPQKQLTQYAPNNIDKMAIKGSEKKLKPLIDGFLNVTSKIVVENPSVEMASYRAILSQMRKDSESRFGTGDPDIGKKAVPASVILRFMNPILNAPKIRGVEFEYANDNQKENGKLLSKVVMNMANRTTAETKKEPFMAPFNAIGAEQMSKMDDLMDKITA
jgi:hypothetical protein